MTKTAIGITALAIHLIICILIWSGIRTGFLKAKMYMLSLAVFVPVWGPVCVLLIPVSYTHLTLPTTPYV